MPRFLILLLYNLLYVPVLFFMAPGAIRKMRARGGKASDLRQRFGRFSAEQHSRMAMLRAHGPVWWLHAVSVGEVGVAAKLIREMLRRDERRSLVLSTTTPTGFAGADRIAREFPDRVMAIYSPLDLWFVVRRCLRFIQPRQLVLVEAEIWPNLVFAARRAGIETSLVNARLSPRSERRYGRVLPWVRPIFSMLSQCLVQDPADAGRWENLGIPRERITCVGSIKYDTAGELEPLEQAETFRTMLETLGWRRNQEVLLAASTHPGEEGEIARVFKQLKAAQPDLKCIIVPRHAERAAAVEEELCREGWHVARRSQIQGKAGAKVECLLVDSTGELRAWQHCATVVVIGKSFLGSGGQNPAEAITAGRPVIFGPHMENFEALVRQLRAAAGAVQVRDFVELRLRLAELLQDPEARTQLVRNGRLVLQAHEGATARTADLLEKRLTR